MLPGLRRRLAQSHALAAAVWLLFLCALFWRLWSPIEGARRTFGKDAVYEYWGDLQFQRDAYADGELPLWNPYDRTGYPFHTDPQAGVLYPVTWLLVAGAAVAGDTPHWLIALKIVLHFWLACFGTWFYLRRRGVHPAACYAGGAVFILSYPFLHNVFSALNWGIAWTPWLLAAIDAWAARPTRARAALVALAAAMSCLAGAPASFFYAMLVALPYGVWAVINGARAAADRRAYRRAAAISAATAAGLFLAITAAQLRATASVVDHTVRGARDLAFITGSTFGVDDIAALLIPRMLGGNTYLGAAAAIWAALALSAFATGRRLVLAGIAAGGFALALGHSGDFLAASSSIFEPFGYFRRAHRYLYVTQLPIAILAAEGLDAIVRLERPELGGKILRGVLTWGVLALTIFGVGFAMTQKPDLAAQPLRDAFVLACLSTAVAVWVTAMVLTRPAGWKLAFAWIGAVALAADLWFARGSDIEQRMAPIPRPRRDGEVAALEGVPLGVRIYDRDYIEYRPGTRLGIRDLGGYEDDPLALSRYHRLLDAARAAPRHLGHLDVGWLLEASSRALDRGKADRAALAPVRKGVHRVIDPAPAILWTARAELVGGAEPAARALLGQRPGTVAVLERDALSAGQIARVERMAGAASPAAAPSPPRAGRLVELERNRLVAEIDAPAAGVVVVHEAYFPGWTARVDGEEAALFPANAAFRGLLVGPGRHRIEMEYRPAGARLWAGVSLAGFFGALALALAGLRREREPPPNPPGGDASALPAGPPEGPEREETSA